MWATAEATNGVRTLLFRFRMSPPAGIDFASYPHLVTIAWPYDSPNAGGMPDGPTNDRMVLLEDLIDAPLERADNAHLVWVMTGGGIREWQWYSRDVGETLAIINQALSGHAPFPIEITQEQDISWSVYRRFLASVVTPTTPRQD
jgi:hypothetical protein